MVFACFDDFEVGFELVQQPSCFVSAGLWTWYTAATVFDVLICVTVEEHYQNLFTPHVRGYQFEWCSTETTCQYSLLGGTLTQVSVTDLSVYGPVLSTSDTPSWPNARARGHTQTFKRHAGVEICGSVETSFELVPADVRCKEVLVVLLRQQQKQR